MNCSFWAALSLIFLGQSPAFHLPSEKVFRRDGRFFETAAANEKEDPAMTAAPPLLISLRGKLVSADKSDVVDGRSSASLVLASQSPRRREILDMMGLAGTYSCEPPPLEEESLQLELRAQGVPPTEYTKMLAEAKAHSLAAKRASEGGHEIDRPVFYLGSDTVVDVDGDKILEKPKNEEDAKKMLRKLSGREVRQIS